MALNDVRRRDWSDSDEIAQLREWLGQSETAIGFTGAGVSTESGIPDYRTPNTPWERNKPLPFDVFIQSDEARRESWRRHFAMDDLYGTARPGICHLAFAEFVRRGSMSAVITQNIDGLHQLSGIPDDQVIELHGNSTYATCLECGRRYELNEIKPIFEATGKSPVCDDCGGIVKPAIISFGQAMPERAMRQAQERTLACDLFLAVGSSLIVYPAAGFPLLAKENGARLVIVNREPTGLDGLADLVLNGEVGDIFSALL